MKSTTRTRSPYPQSGERIRGRHNIQQSRFQPNKKRFTVRRTVGGGDLWVTEFALSYDGIPSYAVSIMEFREGKVANETQFSPIGLILHPRVRTLWSALAETRPSECAARQSLDRH